MRLFFLILPFILISCSSTMHVADHHPVRAQLPDNLSFDLGLTSGTRVRGAMDDRATPLDKTPYQKETTLFIYDFESRLNPWSSFRVSGGQSSPLDLGLNILPIGSDGGVFRLLFGVNVGMYFKPITIEAKDIQGPQKVRKGLLSAWNWNVLAALGFRVSDWWLISVGIRRQAFDISRSFMRGIEDEWSLGGDNVTYFVDQGFNLGPWRGNFSIFQVGRRLGGAEREKNTGFAASLGLGL